MPSKIFAVIVLLIFISASVGLLYFIICSSNMETGSKIIMAVIALALFGISILLYKESYGKKSVNIKEESRIL